MSAGKGPGALLPQLLLKTYQKPQLLSVTSRLWTGHARALPAVKALARQNTCPYRRATSLLQCPQSSTWSVHFLRLQRAPSRAGNSVLSSRPHRQTARALNMAAPHLSHLQLLFWSALPGGIYLDRS